MYIPPDLHLQMARARQADLLAEAQRRQLVRLVRQGRASQQPNRPRRAAARYLVAVARRLDPSLRARVSLPAVHTR